MSWSLLASQFCLELAFGVFFALAFVPRAPVGVVFYRILATAALVPLALACVGPTLSGVVTWRDPMVVSSAIAVLAYPAISGPLRGWKWGVALAWSLCWTGSALAFAVLHSIDGRAPIVLAISVSSAMSTGCVAGTVGVAMVLGHWHLTVPTLPLAHLKRMNRVIAASIVGCLAMLALNYGVNDRQVRPDGEPLLDSLGVFFVATRVVAGLLIPLAFSWMAAGALRFSNTRSATGILYASTILVLIGTAVAVSLQDSYGMPL